MWRTNAWIILAIALVIRGTVAWLGIDSLGNDPDSYARLAITWSNSGVFGIESEDGQMKWPSAFRPPFYPWLLSLLVQDGVLQSAGVALLHCILGVATVWLTLMIARSLGQPIAWLPALAVAVDPLLLRQSQLIMTETVAALLAVLAWQLWLVVWPGLFPKDSAGNGPTRSDVDRSLWQWLAFIGLGMVLGVSILARPTAAPWVALCAVGILLGGAGSWKRRLKDGIVISVLVLCFIVPWTLRNYRIFGKPIWATTHGGYTLLLANNPLLFQHFAAHGASRSWDAEPFHSAWERRNQAKQRFEPSDHEYWFDQAPAAGPESPRSELDDDQLAYKAAWATIARQPGMFGLSCFYRVGWLWALWPNARLSISSTAIGFWYAAIFALAIPGIVWGIRRAGFRSWLLPLALALTLTAVHSIYWSNMRMRAPVMAPVYVAVGEAVGRIWSRLDLLGSGRSRWLK